MYLALTITVTKCLAIAKICHTIYSLWLGSLLKADNKIINTKT